MDQSSTPTDAPPAGGTAIPFFGLAPFLRASIAGEDLGAICRELLVIAQHDPDDANAWMNLSIATLCLGQRDLGLAMQAQALAAGRLYRIVPAEPAVLRLLVLMAPGELSANTPLDCLLEGADVELLQYYVSPDAPLPNPVPEHDAVFGAIGESPEARTLPPLVDQALAGWPKPVLNLPRHLPATEREAASRLLQGVPGLLMPACRRVPRALVQAVAEGGAPAEAFETGGFPIIIRPVESHGGHGLDRAADAGELARYLTEVDADEFFVSPYIDYADADGQFRKFRIALVDGVPYPCHMAVSSHWIVHYVNAGMYQDAGKRAEELQFMTEFEAFAARHHTALDAIHSRMQLDYVCIDCAQTRAGELLIFEVDHAMVVHAMDSEELFPYKQTHMRKVRDAFRALLRRRCGIAAAEDGAQA